MNIAINSTLSCVDYRSSGGPHCLQGRLHHLDLDVQYEHALDRIEPFHMSTCDIDDLWETHRPGPSHLPSSAVTESAVAESAVTESAVVESAVVESAVVESAVVESAVVESAVVESAVAESVGHYSQLANFFLLQLYEQKLQHVLQADERLCLELHLDRYHLHEPVQDALAPIEDLLLPPLEGSGPTSPLSSLAWLLSWFGLKLGAWLVVIVSVTLLSCCIKLALASPRSDFFNILFTLLMVQ